jgi:hypothetical protein
VRSDRNAPLSVLLNWASESATGRKHGGESEILLPAFLPGADESYVLAGYKRFNLRLEFYRFPYSLEFRVNRYQWKQGQMPTAQKRFWPVPQFAEYSKAEAPPGTRKSFTKPR